MLCGLPPKVQLPPLSCVPRKAVMSIAAPLLHTVVLPLLPAFGAVVTLTVTVAEALAQGEVPLTV